MHKALTTRLDVESLLHWVYRDELPKKADDVTWASTGSSWVTERVGGTPNYDHHTYPIAAGPPHLDALRIDYAVRAAFSIRPYVDLDWRKMRELLLGEYAVYLLQQPTELKLGINALALVMLHAQMGTRPQWDVGRIALKPVGGKQPKIFFVEPDGTATTGSKRAGYYSPGACTKLEHDPPLRIVAEARAEYFVWWQAIDRIATIVSTLALDQYGASPPRAAPTPWLTGETDKRNVLSDKSSVSALANHTDSRRLFPRRLSTTIGPPKKSPRAGPVRIIKP